MNGADDEQAGGYAAEAPCSTDEVAGHAITGAGMPACARRSVIRSS
jgi:hypothetical protein